ncbi:hypothetical protein PISL3812_00514 [Talaromyces islandicus]|uniref:Carboxylic ester hydrolase n=1 Tax=Talaromyces islandicus TaxID=28573 RepID=A0A0U1LJM2_TALIS|nr:hypothetical protein PISL3812_00514 [Talaromyces islandicus]
MMAFHKTHLALSSFLFLLGFCSTTSATGPTVSVKNGTYEGVFSSTYDQDFFLGIPFAQPPLGSLRFHQPVSLNTSWEGVKKATEYYPECVGYGSDDWPYPLSEDCLALNVVRPAGYENESLPVAVWIHGGRYAEGGTRDQRYNLSFIVQNSVEMGKPIIGAAVAYRLSGWGFIDGQEIRDAGATNIGIQDQRLALHWIQENIAAFGGDPRKVTIWGESAGAGSVGIHLTAYNGRDDHLFRAAISESGGPISLAGVYNATEAQGYYDAAVATAGCSSAKDTLECLRQAPFEKLNTAFNTSASTMPYTDGDIIAGPASEQLARGDFVHVPYLIGTNFDEGASFSPTGINNDSDLENVLFGEGFSQKSVRRLLELYPDVPDLGIPATYKGRPDYPTPGLQYKRSAAVIGDYVMHACRRLSSQTWAREKVPSYAYHFNVLVNGMTSIQGSGHFMEVAFVYDNTNGVGYYADPNPFGNEPDSFFALAKLMSRSWVSFVHDLDPNNHGVQGIPNWPVYELDKDGYGQDFVFETNATSHPEADTWRKEGIAYLNSVWSELGK